MSFVNKSVTPYYDFNQPVCSIEVWRGQCTSGFNATVIEGDRNPFPVNSKPCRSGTSNYTYEVASWLFFSSMVQSLPALLFTTAGFTQMIIWAQQKHRAYKKEFSDYPKGRKAIVPFHL